MQPGERIRFFRKNKGLTQKKFAEELEYSQNFLSAIEIGKVDPSREFLKKLNEVFGLSSDYILYGGLLDQTPTETAVPSKGEYQEKGPIATIREPEIKYRKIIDDVIEILESGNKTRTIALKANIKAFVESVRLIKKIKSKGGD